MEDIRPLFQTVVQNISDVTLELSTKSNSTPPDTSPGTAAPQPSPSSTPPAAAEIQDVYLPGSVEPPVVSAYPKKFPAASVTPPLQSGLSPNLSGNVEPTLKHTSAPLQPESALHDSVLQNEPAIFETAQLPAREPVPVSPTPLRSDLPPAVREQPSEPFTALSLPPPFSGISIETHMQPVSLPTMTRVLQNLFRPLFETTSVSLRISARGDAFPSLSLDALHTEQILTRLLAIVSRLSHKGDNLDFVMEQENLQGGLARVRFAIQATGCVLPAEVSAYLSAEQARPLQDPSLGNLAMNLGLCKNLALLMGGSLILHSSEEGGVLFLLELSARHETAEDDGAAPVLAGIGRFSGRHVLLSEADALHADEIAALLAKREVFVDTVHNTFDALRRFRQSAPMHYAAILTDSPAATAESIRSLRRPDTLTMPIIGIRDANTNVNTDALPGVDFCLIRPFTPLQLFQVLNAFIP